MKISGILMASGNSSRFGEDKAFLEFKDTNFIENTLDMLISSKLYEIKAVVNSKLFDFLKNKKLHQKVELVLNQKSKLGQSKSIQLGVMSSSKVDGFMFVALDQPFLTFQTVNLLIDSFRANTILVPHFRQKSSLPTIFDRRFKDELINICGDKGGRDIIKKYSNLVQTVEIEDEKEGFDVDTKEDFKRLKEML